jgi:ApbE family
MPQSSNDFTMILDNFPGLGTLWWVQVFDIIDEGKKQEIAGFLEKEIAEFDDKYSRFKPKTSLLFKQEMDNTDLVEMLEFGDRARKISFGVFDLRISNLLTNAGYGKEKTMSNLDLGGIGKGFLIDKLRAGLQEKFQLTDFIINGGGDIFVQTNQENGREIILENPFEPGISMGSIWLKNQAICCSSNQKRIWKQKNQTHSHILNLFSPYPSKILSPRASIVIANSATEADVLATILCLDYSAKTIWIESMLSPSLVSVMVPPDNL